MGAGLPAMPVNDSPCLLANCDLLETFASRLAPTVEATRALIIMRQTGIFCTECKNSRRAQDQRGIRIEKPSGRYTAGFADKLKVHRVAA